MDYYTEAATVEKFKRVTPLSCADKRRKIAELSAAVDAAVHTPATRAAGLLPAIWRARISLNWGCNPIVGR